MRQRLSLHNRNGVISVYHTKTATPNARGSLICVHGGPGGDHHGNANIFDDIASFCAPLGFDVLQFDMFGAGESEGAPADITLATQLSDYSSVLDYARNQLPGPIHIVGESMGATIAALKWQVDIASYVLLWPAFDLRDTDLRPYLTDEWDRILREQGYLEDGGNIIGKTFVDELRSYDFSGCFRLPAAPCLLVHGKKDTAVPFEQSLSAVAHAGGEAVLFAHPSGDHGLQRKDERDFTREAFTWWFSR